MNNIITKNYVGVDVSKHELEIYVHPIGKRIAVKNNETEIKKLIEFLENFDIEQIVFDTSGGYEFLMMRMLQKRFYKVWQVEPKRIKAFIISEGKRAKTDQIDAKMIALFASKKKCLHPRPLYNDHVIDLKDLSKRRDDILTMVSAEKNREQQAHNNFCKMNIQNVIKLLEKQLKQIEKKIQKIIKKDNALTMKYDLVKSIPGIGKTTAALLVGCLTELGSATDKEIAALAAVAPYVKQSGKYKQRSRIYGGRSIDRESLYMVAMCAIQFNKKFKDFYQKLKDNKKKSRVALIAVIRKIIIIANVLVERKKHWEENYA